MSLADRLEEELRSHALSDMPTHPGGDVSQMSFSDLLLVYGTWRSRLIPARPRIAHQSAALVANPKSSEHSGALQAIVNKIERGVDLRPHLSRRINFPHVSGADQTRQPLHSRRDRDLLIADWGVHHLHLSTVLDADGFVQRTDDLLFAVFAGADAYLINVYPHGSWGLREIIEIYVREWPAAGTLRPIQGIHLAQHPTEADALELRNAGVEVLLEIDGTVYMPPGQTTAGTPLAVTMRVHHLLRVIDEIREREAGTGFAAELDGLAGLTAPGEWSPLVHDGVCGFVRDGLFVPCAQLP